MWSGGSDENRGAQLPVIASVELQPDIKKERCEVSGQAVQPVPLASLKLSMALYGQKLDGRPSR